jgi:hypothetical protein
MQRKKFILISALLLTGWFSILCQAAIVVDTGPGPSSGNPWFIDSIHNGMAGKFTTTRTYNITSVEAWMQVDAGGPATAVIYRDDGGGEVPGTKRFSQSFMAAVNPIAAWQGVRNLNWSLPPGTYWVGFEVDTPGMEGLMYFPAPHPLTSYAYNILGVGSWQPVSGLEVGFRIQGNPPSLTSSNSLLLD